MSTSPQALIEQYAEQYGVDPNLALAVAQQESGFSQAAISSAGAIGVMQLMPATAQDLGVDAEDTTQNIQGGVEYLAQMLSMFGGNVPLALAAYKAGPGTVQSLYAEYGPNWLSYAPAETQNYVSTVMANAGISAATGGLATGSASLSTVALVAGGALALLLVLDL